MVAKQRAKRTSRKHPGVRLMTLADGRHVARWNDPVTRALRQESLTKLGLGSQRAREQWAVSKSQELAAVRLAASLSSTTPAPMTIEVGLADYAGAKPVAARTAMARKLPLDSLSEYCSERGIRRLDQLTAPKLWGWRDKVVGDASRKESTRNLWLAAVAAFLRWAVSRDLAPLLPLEKVAALTKRIGEPERMIELLRPPELRKVLQAAIDSDAKEIRQRRPVAAFVMTLGLSGMRYAEAAGLDWREVHDSEIRLPPERVKNRRGRAISMLESPTLAALLNAMRRGQVEGLVFRPEWHPQVWREHQKRIVKASGVTFTPRTLRRTCGSILANAPGIAGAASVWFAAQRLGHTVAVAEKHYLGALPGLPAEARTIEAAAGIEDLCEVIIERTKS